MLKSTSSPPVRPTRWLLAAAFAVASPAFAHADAPEDAPPAPPPAPAPTRQAPDLPDVGGGEGDGSGDRLRELQLQLESVNERLRRAESASAGREGGLTFSGYIDFGFFVPNGNNGVGVVRDFGNLQFPQYAGYSWVFLGDPLATAVNTRGEAASLGDLPGVQRFDSVNSKGAPGFIANEINLRLGYEVAENAIARASVNFVPRSGTNFALGDFVDIDIAELEYMLTRDGKTSLFVGKTLPVFGIEYKERKSDQRFGITPSLVQRYTSGSQLGLKFRSKLLDDWVILAGSASNSSSVTEQFHFYREIDANSGKTLSGRAAVSAPLGRVARLLEGDRFEVGLSGEWGSQDIATDNSGKISFAGVDVQYLGSSFWLKAQGMRGKAPGRPIDGAYHLHLHNSGYVELNWQPFARFGLLGRAEFRRAFVSLGTERAYITKEIRYTGGVRIVFTPHTILKLEYLNNREYGGIAEFKNDVFTSSLVLGF